MAPFVTQRFGPVTLAAEPPGYYQADAGGPLRAFATSFPGGVYGVDVHRGLDIRAYQGVRLLAAEAGTVIVASTYANGERFLHLRVNPTTVLGYHHLSNWARKVGDVVARGDVVAYSGSTGNSTAAHLHFEVRITEGGRDIRYNPARFLAGGDMANDPRILPPGASQGDDVNAKTQAPGLLCKVAPTTLYLDEAMTKVYASPWPGFEPVGLYSTAENSATKALAIRVDNGTGGSDYRLVYAPFSAISNVRANPALCPPGGDCTAAIAAATAPLSARIAAAKTALG